jgi:hypothetical protein
MRRVIRVLLNGSTPPVQQLNVALPNANLGPMVPRCTIHRQLAVLDVAAYLAFGDTKLLRDLHDPQP